jgi:HEXXH motif-containing protein
MRHDFTERVKRALANPGPRPWLPDLTAGLAEAGWEVLSREIGLTPSLYGTARVIARDPAAPRHVMAHISASSAVDGMDRTVQIEILGQSFARKYEARGIGFYTAEEMEGGNLLDQVEEAISLLGRIPTLVSTVATTVRSLHLIKPEDEDYDVSFSEPHIPFSVFVSVPLGRSDVNVLRVAEAIVHEAMHLQLTLIEQVVPLVNETSEKFFSPWRGELREARGIIHGLYVFRVIDKFLLESATHMPSGSKVVAHIRERRSDIAAQINKITIFQHCADLSESGVGFTRQLINNC